MISGLERDGIFVTPDVVHYIECTISKSKSKATQDIRKLDTTLEKLERRYRRPVILWFITKEEPTAEQKSIAQKTNNPVRILSLNNFISTIFDAAEYLHLRGTYNFGSVRDPLEGQGGGGAHEDAAPTRDRSTLSYINTELADMMDRERNWNSGSITKELKKGKRFVVLGQYGVGKSMSLRDIFQRLDKEYRNDKINIFPLYINLRDHDGQTEPVEVLERHARLIGYPVDRAYELVRAWRGGFVVLMLDGFDELATIGWASKVSKLQSIRYRSMEIIRRFIKQSPPRMGIIISGRTNYFDSMKELVVSLGISSNFRRLSIDDFQPQQVEQYLRSYKIESQIPDWLPSRPLLLGYLIAKKVISELPDSNTDPAEGWNLLISEIAKREADIDAGVTAENVKMIMGKLASKARTFTSNLGPITDQDLSQAFEDVVGYAPDDRGISIIQRLPGLGFSNEDGARHFIDENLASAAKAAEVARYVVDPFNHSFGVEVDKWGQCLRPLGSRMLRNIITSSQYQINKGRWETAVDTALKKNFTILALDIYLACRENFEGWSRDHNLIFHDAIVPFLEITEDLDESQIYYDSIYIETLEVVRNPNFDLLPRFKNGLIEEVIGFEREEQLNEEVFIECEFGRFESHELTTNRLLDMDLPAPVKVAYTILKKLYIQKGGGRRQNAFSRGLDHSERRYVPEVLNCLSRNGYAILSSLGTNNVWLAVKDKKKEVPELIGTKNSSHPLIQELESLA